MGVLYLEKLINFDKPFLDYSELITLLQHKYNLVIPDEQRAIHILKLVSYYDLINGYKDVFMVNEQYDGKTSIEFLYSFYLYDKNFQNIIFSRIMIIENYFKNILACQISKDFGVDADTYLKPSMYRQKARGLNVQKELASIKYQLECTNPSIPTAYYLKHHNHVPAWILLKNISFGNSINLFRILKPAQQNPILDEILPSDEVPLSQRKELLVSGLDLLRSFRNKIAHNLKFVTHRGTFKQSMSVKIIRKFLPEGVITKKMIEEKYIANDLYAVILFIFLVLNDSFLKSQFYYDLINKDYFTLSGNEYLQQKYRQITGLPENIEEIITLMINISTGC